MVSRKKEPIQASQSEQVEEHRADDGPMEEGHEGLFFCPEPNCQRSFQYITYLENHVLAEEHVYELQQLTLHDKARIGYAEGCKPGTSKQLSSGWVLKQTKKSKRFSKKKIKQKTKTTTTTTTTKTERLPAEKVPSRNGMWKKVSTEWSCQRHAKSKMW